MLLGSEDHKNRPNVTKETQKQMSAFRDSILPPGDEYHFIFSYKS